MLKALEEATAKLAADREARAIRNAAKLEHVKHQVAAFKLAITQ